MPSLLALSLPILFNEVIVILVISVVVVLLFARLRLPAIIGFMVTGVIIGPTALGLVQSLTEVEVLAEIGVVLLMFTIGLEFSIADLARIRRSVFVGGTLQVGLTIAVVAVAASSFGLAWNEAVFLGFLFSLSSTAIVLKLLQDRQEVSALHGSTILAILIFQDVIVVPMMLLAPIMAGASEGSVASALGLMLGKFAFVLLAVWVGTRVIMPRLLFAVARTRIRELFLLTTVATCFAVAWGTYSLGLSLALGAFLAGLIISESEYSYEAVSNVIPFREVFASFFFVSIGMLLDTQFLIDHLGVVLALSLAAILAKALIAGLAAWALHMPLRTTLLVGLSLAQVGEFAFILSKVGQQYSLVSPQVYQYFLAVSLLTMSLTPVLILYGESIVQAVLRIPSLRMIDQRRQRLLRQAEEATPLSDHLVVIGYGLNGRNVVKAAKAASVPYVILESNPTTVRQEQALGEPIYFGDAAQHHVLEHARVASARVVVLAISDATATRRVVASVRQLTQAAYLIVRTRYAHEVELLHRLGASEVVPEEFETSIQIFSSVLTQYQTPDLRIETLVEQLRSDGYELLRRGKTPEATGRVELTP